MAKNVYEFQFFDYSTNFLKLKTVFSGRKYAKYASRKYLFFSSSNTHGKLRTTSNYEYKEECTLEEFDSQCLFEAQDQKRDI